MYKRRFTTPLHPNASNPTSAVPVTAQPSCNQQQSAAGIPSAVGPSTTHQTTASEVNTEKENVLPVPEEAAAKKPRLFIRPTHSAVVSTGAPAAPIARPAPAAPKASDAAPSRIFSVLYCNRNKFKVCNRTIRQLSGMLHLLCALQHICMVGSAVTATALRATW